MNKYFILFLLFLFTQIDISISKKSCNGFCNTNKLVQNECMCNDDCIHNNNCCIDFFMVCPSKDENTSTLNISIPISLNNYTYSNFLRKNINKNYGQEQEQYLFNKLIYLNLLIFIIIFNIYMYIKTQNY